MSHCIRVIFCSTQDVQQAPMHPGRASYVTRKFKLNQLREYRVLTSHAGAPRGSVSPRELSVITAAPFAWVQQVVHTGTWGSQIRTPT